VKRAIVLALLGLLVAAPAATAKGDVHARLESRLARNAKAGETIRVVWRLYYLQDGRERPFGAGDLFVRLRSAAGGRATKAYGNGTRGRFTARVKVPRGGIAGIRFGLEGIRIIGDRTEPAPVYFPLDNDPFNP